jgi:hypothetical protein
MVGFAASMLRVVRESIHAVLLDGCMTPFVSYSVMGTRTSTSIMTCHFSDSSAHLTNMLHSCVSDYSPSGRTRPTQRSAARLPCLGWAVTLVTLHLTHSSIHHAEVSASKVERSAMRHNARILLVRRCQATNMCCALLSIILSRGSAARRHQTGRLDFTACGAVFACSAGVARSGLHPTVRSDVRTGLVRVGVRSSLIARGTRSACDGAVRTSWHGLARDRQTRRTATARWQISSQHRRCGRRIFFLYPVVCALLSVGREVVPSTSQGLLDVIRLAHLPATQLFKLGRSAQRPHLYAPDPARTQTQT